VDLLSYFLGISLSWAHFADTGLEKLDLSGAVDAGVAYPLRPGVGLGLHVRGSQIDGVTGDGAVQTYWSVYTCDVAATLHFTGRRVLFAPWLGARLAQGTTRTFFSPDDGLGPSPPNVRSVGLDAGFALGMLVAVDVWRADPHGIAIYGEIETGKTDRSSRYDGTGDAARLSYAASIGVAYRR
jgi:hypothetical protein